MESKSTRVVVAVYDLSPVTVHIRIEFVDGLVGQCVSLLHVDENKSQWEPSQRFGRALFRLSSQILRA